MSIIHLSASRLYKKLIVAEEPDLKYIILIVAAWIVGMIYISRGIREINRISALAGSAPLPDQPKS